MNHLNKDWLYQKYIVEELSTYDIGKIVNRDPKRIYEKLKDFDIPTRPRGLNLKGGDCYMKKEGVINPFYGKSHTDETRKILSDKATKPKPYLRGKRNGMAGRTGATNPNYIDGSSPERQTNYASAEWKDLIRKVYARDGYKCIRCASEKQGRKFFHAHHIEPWAGNPSKRFDIDNLATLCRKCHEWVHSRENINHDFLKV